MKRSPGSSAMLFAAAAAVALSGGPAAAFSHRVCGRSLDLRVSGPLSPRQWFRAEPWNVPAALACPASNPTFPIPLPTGATSDDPTVAGGSITFRDSSSGSPVTYALPASNWAGLGNPPGVQGYRYNNTVITPGNPCSMVRVTPMQLLAKCKSTGGLGLPLTGTGQVTLTLGSSPGSSYCAEFGGSDVLPPTVARHSRRKAPRPAPAYPCP